jgi:hypothetical protein
MKGCLCLDTLIPPLLPHNAVRFNQWSGLFGRVHLDGHFPTIVTNPEPLSKQVCYCLIARFLVS